MNTNTSRNLPFFLLAGWGLSAFLGISTVAANDNSTLEEVIVTSKKRPQSLQDVPISVVAITGVTIEKMGVEDIEDLTVYAPNIHYTETGFSTQLRIRGIGSDNSQGFEQSVGVNVNGVPYSRAPLLRAPIFDLERVEIMRGPQGTLFGKNSIAGAVDIITAKPTQELEGKLEFHREAAIGSNEFTGVLSGPLSDDISARVALRTQSDSGYMWNDHKNQFESEQDQSAARLSLHYEPSDALSFLWIGDSSSFDSTGRSIEITQDVPAAPGFPAFHQVLAMANGGTTFDPDLDYVRSIDGPESNPTD